MKYIRTSTGILDNTKGDWEVVDRFNRDGDKLTIVARKQDIHETYITSPKFLIRQADTIEELCDSFVMFCPNAHRRKIRVYETMHSISLYFKRDKRWNGNMVDKVYGAIWTDEGLIYVAKMNDKGELELL